MIFISDFGSIRPESIGQQDSRLWPRTTSTFPFSAAEGCWAFPAATIAIATSGAAPSLFDHRYIGLLVTDSAENKGLSTTGA
jgi:hypothetical protein